jgi:glycerophosphoryl diester phosphodiesterase
VPVVDHDPCGARLFGNPTTISQLSFANLRAQMPQIPSLAELVQEFGGNTHLMLEITAEHYPQPQEQKAILQALLSRLLPGRDYHFLALAPEHHDLQSVWRCGQDHRLHRGFTGN